MFGSPILRRPLQCALAALLLTSVACEGPTASSSPAAFPSRTPAASPTPAGVFAQQDEVPMPEAREEVAVAALGERLFVLAGYDARGADTNTVYVFDARQRVWQQGPGLPVALNHPAAAALEGSLYLAGGYQGSQASPAVYRLDAGGARWMARAPLRHPRGALGLVALKGHLYALGGRAGSEVGQGEVYDPAADAWSDLPALLLPRNHVAAVAYHDMACVAGGRSPNTDRVDCWDPAAARWVALPPLPRPTSGAAAAVLAGRMLVLGGEEARIIDLFAVYDGQRWSRPVPMRVPRHGLGAALVGDRVLACAGGTSPGLKAVSSCTSITLGAPS